MKFTIVLFFPLYLFANATFITPIEYASQLYKNPRGIGCHKCHGENGEGMLIAKYSHKNKIKEFRPPSIRGLSFKKFYNALSVRKKGMPRYFLTRKEVEALFLYLNQSNVK